MTSGSQDDRHPSLEDGMYLLTIVSNKYIDKARRTGKAYFITEADVTQSNNPMHPVGQRVSCWINMSQMDMRGKHMANLVCAVYGHKASDLPKDTPVAPWVEQATGKQEPWHYYTMAAINPPEAWAGATIGVTVETIAVGADKSGRFSLHTYEPAEGFVMAPLRPKPVEQQAAQGAPQQQAWTQHPTAQQQAPQQGWQPQAAPAQPAAPPPPPPAAPAQQYAQQPAQPAAPAAAPAQQYAQPAAAPAAQPAAPPPGAPPQGGWGQPPQ